MARGRPRTPDEIKALKGNPGKRRLALDKKPTNRNPARSSTRAVPIPKYLTADQEKQFFREALLALPANLVRRSDRHVLARWATYMARWVTAKLTFDGKETWYESKSNHGKLLRDHPFSKKMDHWERTLQGLEDRIGLNVVARNNIVHRMFNMPAPIGDLFSDVEDESAEKPADEMTVPASPLNFLEDGDKPAGVKPH